MNYVITGSIGNVSKPVTEKLVAAGHNVTVITSHADRVPQIEAIGAKALVGSLSDEAFVGTAFAGADAVYLMIPPNFGVINWFEYQKNIANNYTKAITQHNIINAVVLSSIGAHRRGGVGPVDGPAYLEGLLENLPGINAKFVRPAFFYNNFFGQIGMIKNAGIIGSNYGGEGKMIMVAPSDIADAVADILLNLNFTGISVQYVASDERTFAEVAAVIGNAIGKPDLNWVQFTDEQAKQGLQQAGLSEVIANGYVEMGAAMNSGVMAEDYWANQPTALGKVKLEDFAKGFSAAYNAN